MAIPELDDAATRVAAGQKVELSARTLLGWFGAYRRTWRQVSRMRAALKRKHLMTDPDFEAVWIDSTIAIVAQPAEHAEEQPIKAVGMQPEEPADTIGHKPVAVAPIDMAIALAEPTHRINRLSSANKPPVYVALDATVEQAVTLMLQHDYSQLPVMQSIRDVKGLVSWKSLGARLSMGRAWPHVRDCMDEHREIAPDASLFDAVRIISEHECVLVRAHDKTVCGIVTAYDIGAQFQQFAEPFLLLGDIETHIRYIISTTFTTAELQQVKDPADNTRIIEDVSDLAFGEYVRLLQNNDNWGKLNSRIDRKTFTEGLDKVREIRNDVMHFDPDPIQPSDLNLLKTFARFLDRWQQLTS